MKKINIIFFIITLILVDSVFGGKNRISKLKDEEKPHTTNIKKVIERVKRKQAELESRKARLELSRFQRDKNLAKIISKLSLEEDNFNSFEID